MNIDNVAVNIMPVWTLTTIVIVPVWTLIITFIMPAGTLIITFNVAYVRVRIGL